MKYLGVDFGLRKIGTAIGDDGSHVAVPFELVPGGDDAAVRITQIAKREGVEAFVVGLPIPTDFHQSEEQLERTMGFVTQLGEVSGLPVRVVDEQFSSAEARRIQKEYGAKASEDEIAAMLILQAYFDEETRSTR
ncbi:MAG TPA: Holliday junction resolvase RuvX [bacterium]|nr:Holliday junction resolvase RuvX [bacterium]